MEMQESPNSQTNLKKNKVRELTLPYLKHTTKLHSRIPFKGSKQCAIEIKIEQWNRNVSPNTNLHIYSQWFWQRPRPFNRKKKVFLKIGAGTIRYPHAKEWRWILPHIIHKKLKWIKDLNVRTKIINSWKEIQAINLCGHGLGNDFLNMTLKITSDNINLEFKI